MGRTATDEVVTSSGSRRFIQMARGFWTGGTRRIAWLLTIALGVLLLANLGAALAVNRWNKFFFDALEQQERDNVLFGLGLILLLALFSAASSVGLLHARMRLQVQLAPMADAHADRALARRPAFLSALHRCARGRQPGSAHRRGQPACDRAAGRFLARRAQRPAGRGLLHRHPLGRRRLADHRRHHHPRLHGVRLHHLFGDHDGRHVPSRPLAGAARRGEGRRRSPVSLRGHARQRQCRKHRADRRRRRRARAARRDLRPIWCAAGSG